MEVHTLTYKLKLATRPAKIFIGIPTGWVKEYALLYLLAALRGLDYNPNYFKVVFAVTNMQDKESKKFIRDLKAILRHSNFFFKTEVISTKITTKDKKRWGPYAAVIKNVKMLRKKFLKEDYEFFLKLDADIPPLRTTLQRLLALEADIASPLLFQRPVKAFCMGSNQAFPLVFKHIWTLEDLEEHNLNPEQKRILTQAWINLSFTRCIHLDTNWKTFKTLRGVSFGAGCMLVTREAFTQIPYELAHIPYSGDATLSGYQSEDLQFCQEALAKGFKTAVDLELHCPHLCMDGKAY